MSDITIDTPVLIKELGRTGVVVGVLFRKDSMKHLEVEYVDIYHELTVGWFWERNLQEINPEDKIKTDNVHSINRSKKDD